MIEDDEDKIEKFNRFVNSCAETLHFALQVSDNRWKNNRSREAKDKITELSNSVVSSVIGNRIMDVSDFEDSDYELMFVATLRKALAIVDGVEEL